MSVLSPRVRDDRGRKVARRRGPGGRWRERLLEETSGLVLAAVLLFGLKPAYAFWSRVLIEPAGFDGPFLGILAGAALAIASLAVVVLLPCRLLERTIEQRRQRRQIELMRRCACCEYDLKGLAAEADGLTVCPECGAAWRMEGIEARRHEGTEGKS